MFKWLNAKVEAAVLRQQRQLVDTVIEQEKELREAVEAEWNRRPNDEDLLVCFGVLNDAQYIASSVGLQTYAETVVKPSEMTELRRSFTALGQVRQAVQNSRRKGA